MSRRKRFGSSPQLHAQKAVEASRFALDAVEHAERAYSRGDCLDSGKAIDSAWSELGRFNAHAEMVNQAEVYRIGRAVQARLVRVDETFERTCVRRRPGRE